jgi:hypothetical protein
MTKERAPARLSSKILDAILPLPVGHAKSTAKAIVSTERTFYKVIPRATLLLEIGKRVSNTKIYANELDRDQIADLPHYEPYEKAGWIGHNLFALILKPASIARASWKSRLNLPEASNKRPLNLSQDHLLSNSGIGNRPIEWVTASR